MPRSTGRRVKKKQKRRKYRKATIPKAIREQCWIQVFGEKFKEKCYINWCENEINVGPVEKKNPRLTISCKTIDFNNCDSCLLRS